MFKLYADYQRIKISSYIVFSRISSAAADIHNIVIVASVSIFTFVSIFGERS